MPEIKELQFWMRDPETNRNWNVNFESLKQAIGVCALDEKTHGLLERIDGLWEAVIDIREQVVGLLLPQATMVIIDKFKANRQLDTKQVSRFIDSFGNKCLRWALYESFEHLKKDGSLTSEGRGKGIPRLWRLAKDPLKLVPSKEET